MAVSRRGANLYHTTTGGPSDDSGVAATTDATGTNTYYSDVAVKEQAKDLIIIAQFVRASGTFAGTLTVEICNAGAHAFSQALAKDGGLPGGTFVNALLWDTYDPTGFTIPAISTGGTQIETLKITRLGAAMVRLKYVNATGTGAVSAQLGMN